MLEELGVAKVFTPGATTGEITGWVAGASPTGLSRVRSRPLDVEDDPDPLTRLPGLAEAHPLDVIRRGSSGRAGAQRHRGHPEAGPRRAVRRRRTGRPGRRPRRPRRPCRPRPRPARRTPARRRRTRRCTSTPGMPGRSLVGEHPDRAVVVELLPLLGVLGEVAVEHPVVRRRAHDQRPDPADERVPAAVVLAVRHLEEPVERVVLVGDEAVERAGGEVRRPGSCVT